MTEGERNQLSSRLNAAYDGRARSTPTTTTRGWTALFAAQRLGELVPVVEGLPPLPTYADPAIVASAPSGQPGEVSTARNANAVALFAVGGVVALVVLIAILVVILLSAGVRSTPTTASIRVEPLAGGGAADHATPPIAAAGGAVRAGRGDYRGDRFRPHRRPPPLQHLDATHHIN